MTDLRELMREVNEDPKGVEKRDTVEVDLISTEVLDSSKTTLRHTKEYQILMLEEKDLQEYKTLFTIEDLIEMLIEYEESDINPRVALHQQISMLFDLDVLDLEDDNVRAIALKRLRHEI